MRRGAARSAAVAVAVALLCAPAAASATAVMSVANVSGGRGQQVAVEVALSGSDNQIVATNSDVFFPLNALTLTAGDCTIHPRLTAPGVAKQLQVSITPDTPNGAPPGTRRIRAAVFSISNANVITDGPLFSCVFTVFPNTPNGAKPLGINPSASNALSGGVPVIGVAGSITVLDASIDLNSGSGARGDVVFIKGTLATRGNSISETSSDIFFPLDALDIAPSDCIADPRLAAPGIEKKVAEITVTQGTPPEAPDGTRRLHLVIAGGNQNAIPDGVLYTCAFTITASAPFGSQELAHAPLALSTQGQLITITGGVGSVEVIDVPTQTPTVTRTSTATRTNTSTATRTPTDTATVTTTRTPTVTSTASGTRTLTRTATLTRTPTATGTITQTATASQTSTPSRTATPSETPLDTHTPTVTQTITQTRTASATPSRTETRTPTVTVEPSETHAPSRTPTASFTLTSTRTSTVTRTMTPTAAETLTPTITQTRTQTGTPTYTVTRTATPTLTGTSTRVFTRTSTATLTRTSTATPAETETPTPSETPTDTQTPTETETATATETPTVTETATETATLIPTATPPPPCGGKCCGDCDGDGLRGPLDIARITAVLNACDPCGSGVARVCASEPSGCDAADFDNDGCLTAAELTRVLQDSATASACP